MLVRKHEKLNTGNPRWEKAKLKQLFQLTAINSLRMKAKRTGKAPTIAAKKDPTAM